MATPSIGDECLEEGQLAYFANVLTGGYNYSYIALLRSLISCIAALTEQFFLKLMNDVSDDSKVEKMAIHLNISQATLASLKKEFRVDTPLLATKVHITPLCAIYILFHIHIIFCLCCSQSLLYINFLKTVNGDYSVRESRLMKNFYACTP